MKLTAATTKPGTENTRMPRPTPIYSLADNAKRSRCALNFIAKNRAAHAYLRSSQGHRPW
jgi:hypothetical protein